MIAEPSYPLVTLRPSLDQNADWARLVLEATPPLAANHFAHTLHGLGLAELLCEIPCVVVADPRAVDPAWADGLPRQRLVIFHDAALTGDPSAQAHLALLVRAGFGLTTALTPLGLIPATLSPASSADPTRRSLLLKLLSLVTRDAETAEIEALIKRDANLAYKLIKLVNSVMFVPGRRIENFTQALVLLGRRQLQRWLMLLLFARPPGSDKANPLLPQAALRAQLCEGIARRRGLSRESLDQAYMVGMFSLLDLLFGQPLAEIIAPLALVDEVTQALLTGCGPLGTLLKAARLNDAGPSAELAATLEALGLRHHDWAAALIEAARWAVLVSKEG